MKKNIAVVGCGSWGKNLIRNFNELKALYAICDTDENKLISFRAEYPEVVSYQKFSSLLDDPKVDAAVISTPAVTHYSLTKEALLSGKDVFV